MDHRFLLESLFNRWDRRVFIPKDDKEAMIALPWSHRTVGRDAYLLREGEPTSTCSLLVTGFAFRQKLVTHGARQIISFHIAGEFLDIQNCLLEVADHNVQALTRISVAVIHRDALLELMADRPKLRHAIWLDSAIQSSIFREWVVNVGRRDARKRIAHLLCELADRMKSIGMAEGELYDFPLTQEQIADATGLTAVHTNRTLQLLRKEGLINLSSSRLAILDWDGLCEAGDFNERYLHHSTLAPPLRPGE
ncbi:MAG: Crp/Fnr family transcriptional regulator [Bacillota bacterium]